MHLVGANGLIILQKVKEEVRRVQIIALKASCRLQFNALLLNAMAHIGKRIHLSAVDHSARKCAILTAHGVVILIGGAAGLAYNFHAIVRYVQGSKVGASEGNYLVFPLEGGPNVVTAVNDVTARREVASVTYVNLQGMQSATPFEGINIVVTKYTTGETQVAKQLR